MGLTQDYSYHPFQNWGDAILAVYDDDRAAWFGIGLCRNQQLTSAYTKKMKKSRVNGERVTRETRIDERTCQFSCNWLENLDPRGNQMVFGDKTNTQTFTDWDMVSREFECELHRNDQTGLYMARTHPW